MRRRRFRRLAKWASTLAAVLAVGLAIGSRFCALIWITKSGHLLRVGEGLALMMRDRREPDPSLDLPLPRLELHRAGRWQWTPLLLQNSDWVQVPGVAIARNPAFAGASFSLVYPMVLTSIPAALFWYADRRRVGPHQCKKCDYDRRGLVGGVGVACPECGTVPTIPTK